jgi:hypothetical protein
LAKCLGSRKSHLVATNLNTKQSEIYSRETMPKMPVSGAEQRSMSIPLFFAGIHEAEKVFM